MLLLRFIRRVTLSLAVVLCVVVNALAQAPDWSVDSGAFATSMNLVGHLSMDGTALTDTNSVVAAFINGEVRGVSEPVEFGDSLIYVMTIYSDAAPDTVRFKAYLSESDRIVNIIETIPYEVDGVVGASTPFKWNVDPPVCLSGHPGWFVDSSQFESTLSITASIELPGAVSSVDDRLAAFAGAEIRGVASPTDVDGSPLYFLTAHSNTEGEALQFWFYDSLTDDVYAIDTSIVFAANAIMGSPHEPMRMVAACNGGPTGVAPEDLRRPSVTNLANHPNPFATQTTLTYTIVSPSDVVVSVFDIAGREVARLADGYQSPGERSISFQSKGLPDGVYFFGLQVNGVTHTRKMTIVR